MARSTDSRQHVIARKRVALKLTIDDAYHELKELQRSCTHPDVFKSYGASQGNYDPSADSYWIDYYCPDCEKKWSTPQ